MPRLIPAYNQAHSFFFCARCDVDRPPGMLRREWTSVFLGITPIGLQV